MSIRIGITGANGRMGQANLEAALQAPAGTVSDITGHLRHLQSAGDALRSSLSEPSRIYLTDSLDALLSRSDAVIDFTLPEMTAELVTAAAAAGVPVVSGTTGFGATEDAALKQAAKRIPIVWAPNMSIAVTLFTALVEQAARTLDDNYDIEILEMHHRNKVDAPSGTALGFGRAAAAGRGIAFDQHAVLSREGHTGARQRGSIGFATLRGGQVIGDHSVIFAGENERFELAHKSQSRAIYSEGALRAAAWAVGKPAGLYSMRDVLGI